MIDVEWSETMKKWYVDDSGRVAGYFDTYQEASEYAKSLEKYYHGG